MNKKELMKFLLNFDPSLEHIQATIDNVLIDKDGIVSLNLLREDVRKKVSEVAETFKVLYTENTRGDS
jgi:hypothetical protein